jgi:hypothetical protein
MNYPGIKTRGVTSMSNAANKPGDNDTEGTVLTPEQIINLIIAILEKEATAQDAPARLNTIRNLLTLLKVFFHEYSRGTLLPLLERDLPPDMRSAMRNDK